MSPSTTSCRWLWWGLSCLTLLSSATASHCNISHITVPMLLNSGASLNALGNYDSCLQLPGTHHCVMSFEPPPKGVPSNNTFWLANPLTLTGLCLPVECTAEQVRKSASDILRLVNPMLPKIVGPDLARLLHYSRVEVVCSEDRKSLSSDVGACIMVGVVSLLFALVVCTTAWEWYWDKPPSVHTQLRTAAAAVRRPAEDVPTGTTSKLVSVFSAVRNGRDLFSHRSTATDFLNGMRVFSIAWVVLGHVAVFTKPQWANIGGLDYILEHYAMILIFGAFFAVDTFFFMSGFLQAFIMPPYLLRLRTKLLHGLPLVYLLRFLRITPLLLFVIFAWRITRYMGEGPVFYHYQRSVEWLHCEQYWWTTVLYINNLYPAREKMCLGWSWYLSNDWQFFLLTGPLLLWYAYGSKFQVTIFLLCLLALCVILGAQSKLSILNNSYLRPWNRCAPYIWGILSAMLLQRLKQEASAQLTSNTLRDISNSDVDADRENAVDSTPFFGEERPPMWLRISMCVVHTAWMRRIGYFIAANLMWWGMTMSWLKYKAEWASLYSTTGVHTWGDARDRLYGAYYALAWGMALSLLIVPWGLGYGGYVRGFLEQPLFTPLARLTYGVYLVHPLVIWYTTWQTRTYPTWETAEMTYMFLGQLALATLVSLFCYFLVEKPVANAVSLCAPEKKGGSV